MTTTKTHDIGATLQQIAELTASGCDIVRVACPTDKDADALPIIAKQSRIPVIADIHFKPKYVFQAIEAGCGAVRVNPGNIRKFDDQVAEICKAASDHGVSLRIGVNAGSLDRRLLKKYGKATPEALVESATWEAGLFEECGFHDFKISVKHHDVVTMVQAYQLLSERGDWPLHLGVTEAGPAFQGTIKSCAAFGTLLAQGIGDTIRVSLSAPPVEEVKVGTKLLEFMGLRERKLEIVSCPSCGRAQVDVWTLAEEVESGLKQITAPLRVAVMGCVVNGPGEAREADTFDEQHPILVVGMGRFGQIVNSMLQMSGHSTTIIDLDPTTVAGLNRYGIKTHFGDASRPELLLTAGIENARLLVIAIDNREQALSIARFAREVNPNIDIVARAYDRLHTFDLYQAGANEIVRETFDAAIRAGKRALERLGMSRDDAEKVGKIFYRHDRHGMIEQARVYDPTLGPFNNKQMAELVVAQRESAREAIQAALRGEEEEWPHGDD
mgnify:CR=1 FL=1